MRRVVFFALLGLAVGCDLVNNQPAQTGQRAPGPQQQQPAPGYYYPPPQQPPPGYYYPPPQGGYPPGQQPQQPQGPQQPQQPQQPVPPAPTQPAPAPTQPAPAPSQQPYNPWATLLNDLLKGGAPPIPWPNLPLPGPMPPQPAPATVDTRGLELANAINAYRQQHGLQPIPISKSLAKVADAHVKDLSTAAPMASNCNDHSWTNRGTWTACCYTPDHAQAKCMWYKPSEITPFKGTGFEIAIGQPGEKKPGLVLDSKQAISFWSASQVHNDVLLNKGQWASMTWKSMGAGLVDSHASAWFSDQTDTVTELKSGQ